MKLLSQEINREAQRDPRRLIVGSIRELALGILGRQPTTLRENIMDATTARKYSTRRRFIVGAIADKLNEELNGSAPYRSSVQSVEPRLRFWDEVTDFPSIGIGSRSRNQRVRWWWI